MSLPPRSPCKALTKPPNLSPSRDPTLSVHDHGRFRPGTPRDKRPSWPHQTPRQHGTPSSAPRRPARPIIKLQAKPRVGAALTTEQPTRPTAPYVYEEGLEMEEIRGATFTHKLFHTRSFAWLWAVVRVWLGWQWLTAGWGKLFNPAWMETGAALRGYFTNALGGTAINYDWYRAFLNFLLEGGHYTWFAKLVVIGEVLVGLGLILGAFTGIAAFFGA